MAFDFPDSPAVNDVFVTGTGVSYKWDGTAWRVDTGLVPLPVITRVITYSGAGTYAYVKPATLKSMSIKLWGPGGGGGGAAITAATTIAAGGGGGGGGYVEKLYQASELASSEPLVLGLGGAGGAAGANNGTNGTPSTFKGLTATGGGGGVGSTASATVGSVVGRGAQGAGTGGDFNGGGRSGDQGIKFYHGSTNQALPGYGGSGVDQGQFQPLPTTTATAWDPTPDGPNSTITRGGNGGANGLNQVAAVAGAGGGSGMAIITETLWDPDYVATAPLLSSIRRVSYLAAGSFSYVKPAGLKFADVELYGPGGGGGFVGVTGAGAACGAGGGGGGGYSRKLYAAGDLAATEPLVIGAGGAGATTAGTSGATGTASTFKGQTANGGAGGVSGVVGTIAGTIGRGAGGSASGGDFNSSGGHGGQGLRLPHAIPNSAQGGHGGTPYGITWNLQLVFTTNSGAAGTAALGCGGPGAANGQNQAASINGDTGGTGFAIFTEYF